MSKKLHVGCGPMTGTIFAGTVLKDGRTWGAGKAAMADLIERLRAFGGSDELGNGDFSLLSEAAAALEEAQEDACVALVADIRFACGDNGKRMQPELVEFIRGLSADSARYQWLRARWGRIVETYEDDRLAFIGDEDAGEGWDTAPDSLDAAIDAAIDAAMQSADRGAGVA